MTGMKDLLGDSVAVYPNAPGYQRDSDTSRAAAESMRQHFNAQQQVIINFLAACKERGAIYDEICQGTALKTPSVCGRMVELCESNRVVKSGTRPTASGRPAKVYMLSEFATKGASNE